MLRTTLRALVAAIAAYSVPASATEPAFVHQAATLGTDRVATDFALNVGPAGTDALAVSVGAAASFGVNRSVEYGVRTLYLRDPDALCIRPIAGEQSCPDPAEFAALFEANFALLRSDTGGFQLGVAFLGGARHFEGSLSRGGFRPEVGIELGSSAQLNERTLIFANAGYSFTWLEKASAYMLRLTQDGWRSDHRVETASEHLVRHAPSVTVGIEWSLPPVRPYYAISASAPYDPYRQEFAPRITGIAGMAFVFE